MNASDDSKKFTELKELLEIVKNKIDHMDIRQTGQGATISLMKDQLSVMNSKLDGVEESLEDSDTGLAAINRRLDANSASLMTIEKELKTYGDMYKINGSNRVPPEFQLADIA